MDSLIRVRRATARRSLAEREWRDAVKAAVAEGHSVRAVAREAKVTHPRVIQITQAK